MSKTEEKDNRILEADTVKELLSHRGFKILSQRWEQIKERALADLLNEAIADDSLKARQVIYNQICEWAELPKKIMQEGVNAVDELNEEGNRKEHFIKEDVPFIGRQY